MAYDRETGREIESTDKGCYLPSVIAAWDLVETGVLLRGSNPSN